VIFSERPSRPCSSHGCDDQAETFLPASSPTTLGSARAIVSLEHAGFLAEAVAVVGFAAASADGRPGRAVGSQQPAWHVPVHAEHIPSGRSQKNPAMRSPSDRQRAPAGPPPSGQSGPSRPQPPTSDSPANQTAASVAASAGARLFGMGSSILAAGSRIPKP
jgi:hypothetical protein